MDAQQPSPAGVSPAVAELQSRVERLLLRHAELQRTNALLADRLQQTEVERDQLRHRLHDATQRVDKLLRRLDQTSSIPADPDANTESPPHGRPKAGGPPPGGEARGAGESA